MSTDKGVESSVDLVGEKLFPVLSISKSGLTSVT